MTPCPTCGCTCASKRKVSPFDVAAVVEHYRTHHPHFRGGTSASKEYRAIHARLAEGFDVATLCAAIDGMHRTPHNLGVNERGQKYLGLALCMRDASQVTRFAETTTVPAPLSKANAGTALTLAKRREARNRDLQLWTDLNERRRQIEDGDRRVLPGGRLRLREGGDE